MITDPRVFDDDAAPRQLMHRSRETTQLLNAVEPATDGARAQDVLVSGSSGVGKTALAKAVLRRIDDHADVPWTHLRALGETAGSILRTVITDYPRGPEPASNTPTAELPSMLRETIDAPYLVICDEADDLCYSDALDTLLDCPLLSIVVIVHNPDRWLSICSDRVRQTFYSHIELERFSTVELADILEARADQGLTRGAVATDQLREIADETAGVARRGIQSLHAAALLAEDREHSSITDGDVSDCYERARHMIRQRNLRSLPFHHHVLFAMIHERGPLLGEELHALYNDLDDQLYCDVPQTPVGKRSRRDKLAKLHEYDLIDLEGNGHERTYRVSDAAIQPELSFDVLESTVDPTPRN